MNVILPRRFLLRSPMLRTVICRSLSTRSETAAISRPSAVISTWRVLRANSVTPRTFSTRLIARVSAGWDVLRNAAALTKLPYSASATMARSSLIRRSGTSRFCIAIDASGAIITGSEARASTERTTCPARISGNSRVWAANLDGNSRQPRRGQRMYRSHQMKQSRHGTLNAMNSPAWSALPMATTTYCLPLCMYVIGAPVVPASRSVTHNTLPVVLS